MNEFSPGIERKSRKTPSFSQLIYLRGAIDIYISDYIRLGIGETSKNTRCGRAGLELGHHRSGKERSKGEERHCGHWSTFLR